MIQEVRPYDFGLPLDAAVLGALLTEGTLPDHLRPLLQVERFAHPYRLLARAVKEALEAAGVCDLAATQDRLVRLGGGTDDCGRLREFMEQVPSAAHLEPHLKLLSERGGDGAGQPDQPDPLLVGSGLTTLGENAPLSAIEAALRALVAGLDGADPLRRAMIREAAVRCVEKAGVRSPARLVDDALGPARQEDLTDVQGRPVILTDPDLWPEPVDGAALLDGLSRAFSRFAALPEGAADALALWVLHAYALGATFVSPLLGILSPVRRCGKTLILEILGALVPRRLFASNVTSAVLFRAVEKYHPTLLVDELDTFLEGNDELRGIVNSGHTRTTAMVVRNVSVGDDHEPRIFSTWCPKAVAMIGSLPPTLEDRAIVIPMRRRAPGERLERLRRDRLDDEVAPLPRQAARWAKDHLEKLRGLDPALPEALHDRAQDNWRPLVAIAEVAGGAWPERARRAALILSGAGAGADGEAGILLLADLRDLFHERGGADRLLTANILEALTGMEERPWSEWRKGKPLTPPQLAKLLRKFGVRPKNIRVGEQVVKGYLLTDLEDPLSRYLPPPSAPEGGFEAATPLQNSSDANLGHSPSRYTGGDVAGTEQDLTTQKHSDVAGVAAPEPQSGQEGGVRPGLPLAPGGYPAAWDEPWKEEPEEESDVPF